MNRLGGALEHRRGRRGRRPVTCPTRTATRGASAIKQVASGRFGVTSEYLVNADDLQIKMAQGAKPGEGGELPGHKVYPWIAKTRHSTPGVGLISPPPHHDIYSIEDLKQLIHDLKNANNRARVHVKLVAEVGVGTVAAGVSKAHADVVLISGPRRWYRRGAAHVDQARGRAVGARPGRDAADAAAQRAARPHRRAGRRPAEDRPRRRDRGAARRRGVRVRHRAARRERLHHDARLPPRHVPGRRRDAEPRAAQEVLRQARVRRELLRVHRRGGARAPRGARASARSRRRSATSRCSTCARRSSTGRRAASTSRRSSPLPVNKYDQTFYCSQRPGPRARARRSTDQLIADARSVLQTGERPAHAVVRDPQHEPHRRHDARLGAARAGGAARGCPTARSTSRSTARRARASARSCRAASRCGSRATRTTTSARGCRAGRSCCGPPRTAKFVAEDNIIAGNVILYGATGGDVFIRGLVGERFCVRNSGATAVVEGVGDHGCEYMTGGRAVILGPTGRNFAAGMSGGFAFVLRPRPARCSCASTATWSTSTCSTTRTTRLVARRRHACTSR